MPMQDTMPTHDMSTPEILVIDDDVCIREVVSEILSFEGFQVRSAANGAQALEFVDWRLPALALLDMHLPVLDGWGFARGIRERNVKLPVLVMTAAKDGSLLADEIGADGFVSKPFDIACLIDIIRRLLAPALRVPA